MCVIIEVQAASEVQRNMRMVSRPGAVEAEEVTRFRAQGYRSVLYCTFLYCTVLYCTVLYCTVLYRSVDETQVVRIETNKYFSFLMNMITGAGGEHAMPSFFAAQFIFHLSTYL